MSAISVRQAVLSDLERLVPLFDAYRMFYGGASDEAGARAFLAERFNHGESILFLAEEGARVIGFAQLYPSFSSASMRRTFILNDLYVREEHRRRGVGRLLLEAAAALARRLAAAGLTLSTGIDNSAAQGLYESVGWKRDEQFLVYHLKL